MNQISIGMVGYGMIGRVHCLGYREIPLMYPRLLPELRLASVVTSRAETAQAAAREAGFDAWDADLQALLDREEVDVVDCVTPNDSHRKVLLKAIAARKHIYCEKPLAMNGEEARELVAAAEAAGVQIGMTFNYRFIPAVIRALELIQEGALGEIYTFRADYLHTGYQDPNRPMSWRMRKEQSGGGALVDMGSHVIDLMRFLLGEFEAVQCTIRTFVKERPKGRDTSEVEPVQVDDAAWLHVRLAGGAEGTIHASRFATGTVDDLSFEIYGRLGALRFHLMDPNWLYWYDTRRPGGPRGGERGWTRLETVQHYPGAASPPGRSPIGWARTHAENQFAFLRAVHEGQVPQPNAVDGLRTQLILDAAYASAEGGGWVATPTE
jgi:predicted dehydrogenase